LAQYQYPTKEGAKIAASSANPLKLSAGIFAGNLDLAIPSPAPNFTANHFNVLIPPRSFQLREELRKRHALASKPWLVALRPLDLGRLLDTQSRYVQVLRARRKTHVNRSRPRVYLQSVKLPRLVRQHGPEAH
jgi:hypothetical protein